MQIGCFIDYDNLKDQHIRNGLLNLTTRIVEALNWQKFDDFNNLYIRLYGGWFESTALTSKAQALTLELTKDFPGVLTYTSSDKKIRIKYQAELAFSLLEVPNEPFFSTFRKKQIPHNIKSLGSADIPCIQSNCIAETLFQTIKKKQCNNLQCGRPINDFMFRSEQKMVDTHLVCDLNYATLIYDLIIVVSSDEDFIPILKTLLNRAKELIHIATLVDTTQSVPTKFGLNKLNSINI